MMKARGQQSGFTLMEMLLSIALISIIVGLSLPLYATYQQRQEVSVVEEQVAHMLRRAQVYARGMREDSAWGVRLTPTSAILFNGTTYAGRNSNFDELVDIPAHVTLSATADVIFAKLTGRPSITGTLNIASTSNNQTGAVSLNALGTVTY